MTAGQGTDRLVVRALPCGVRACSWCARFLVAGDRAPPEELIVWHTACPVSYGSSSIEDSGFGCLAAFERNNEMLTNFRMVPLIVPMLIGVLALHEVMGTAPPQSKVKQASVFLGHPAVLGDTAACCFADGTCADLDPDECLAEGGFPHGMGSSCDEVDCTMGDVGACCLADGLCEDMSTMECMLEGGMPHGTGTSCEETDCTAGDAGACCFDDDTCADLPSPMDCMSEAGHWQGWGSDCESTDCTAGGDGCGHGGGGHGGGGHGGGGHGGHTGACCLADDTCTEMPLMDCMIEGGMPYGMGSSCDDVDCSEVPTAACCFEDGTCAEMFPMDCMLQGGTPYGMGTTCDDVDCTG